MVVKILSPFPLQEQQGTLSGMLPEILRDIRVLRIGIPYHILWPTELQLAVTGHEQLKIASRLQEFYEHGRFLLRSNGAAHCHSSGLRYPTWFTRWAQAQLYTREAIRRARQHGYITLRDWCLIRSRRRNMAGSIDPLHCINDHSSLGFAWVSGLGAGHRAIVNPHLGSWPHAGEWWAA
jgi:hypothetical protein